eukprot:gnl/Spiro4/27580_TR13718_c0_g1_i1.p1 gnl/Spiro4/27580_TR13718_c0_g1~~gnl/Spiro4/27580_TR13718_c0_g1_i1.p1  ORF type:complete len:277 (+),score=-37.51 gnl/Spiro4/27580_TR13718_c0_g1_i1:512-1342(+)
MKSPEKIISEAIIKFKPKRFILMVSGGHDSVTNAHISASLLKGKGIEFEVYHGDTTIGIPETQDYVRMICDKYGWKLNIRKPPDREWWYDKIVERYGFPGPTKKIHQFMYRMLKERALNKFVTHELKSSPYSRENILLMSGVRKQESAIRMGYQEETAKDRSKIWTNPIFYYSEQDCRKYMDAHSIPKNPVKELICISGECLCGAFAGNEEWMEIKTHFPATAKIIEQLQKIAEASGHPWPWASGPTEWNKQQIKKMQLKMNFMCVGCESKRAYAD